MIRKMVRKQVGFSPLERVLAQQIPVRNGPRLVQRAYCTTPPEDLPSPTTPWTPFGDEFNIDFASLLEWEIWAFGTYERLLGEFLSTLVALGSVCIDAGANIGIHTVRMAKLASRGRVLAVEADAAIAERPQKNVALNGLQNVRVTRAAATSHDSGTILLHRPASHDPNKGRASTLNHTYLTGSTIEVPTTTVDQLASILERVDVQKIDVGGAESAALVGARETIIAHRPAIVFEFNQQLVNRGVSPIELLRGLG